MGIKSCVIDGKEYLAMINDSGEVGDVQLVVPSTVEGRSIGLRRVPVGSHLWEVVDLLAALSKKEDIK